MKARAAGRIFLSCALFTVLSSTASRGQAARAFSLEVERSEPALTCPDADWFRQRVASYAASSGQAGRFKVTLERSDGTWRARIQSWQQEDSAVTERVLVDRSAPCAPLAQAVAVTIAILAEDYAEPQVAPAPKLNPRPEPLPAPAGKPLPATRGRDEFSVWIGAAGGAAAGFISPVAPVLGLGVALDSKHFRQAVRGTLTTEQNFDLYPGRVIVQAWLASMLSCLRLVRGNTGAALCATFDAGMLSGRAEGFAESTPSTRNYEAVGLELQPSLGIADRARLSVSLAALVPLSRESFSVIGRGVAYVPPSLNGRALVFVEIGAF